MSVHVACVLAFEDPPQLRARVITAPSYVVVGVKMQYPRTQHLHTLKQACASTVAAACLIVSQTQDKAFNNSGGFFQTRRRLGDKPHATDEVLIGITP